MKILSLTIQKLLPMLKFYDIKRESDIHGKTYMPRPVCMGGGGIEISDPCRSKMIMYVLFNLILI